MIEPHVIVDDPAKLVTSVSVLQLCDDVVFVEVGCEHKHNRVSLHFHGNQSKAVIVPDDERIPYTDAAQATVTFVMPFREYITYCDGDKYTLSFFVASMEFVVRVNEAAIYLRGVE